MDALKRRPAGPWGIALAMTLFGCRAARASSEPAEWTVVAVLSGAYVDSLNRFLSVGASDRVHVIVLHDTGASTSVYRVLPDQDSSHAPGDCCPSGGSCCDRVLLPLAELGLTEDSRISEETLDRYFSYVQLHYPARHFLLAMRGHASESSLSINSGGGRVTVPQLADLLAHFSARRDGKKLEVLNLGMCQTANTDWAYLLAPWVETLVGSANYTNPPVAMRWRMHLWVRELIRTPEISNRELAGKMVRLFADTWGYCVSAGHQCSNASNGEPWTVVAVDESALEEVAAAARELVCAASLLEEGSAVRRAVQATAQYGSPGWTRRDFAQFATNLAHEVPGTPLGERALALRGAIERAVLAHASEPGTYPADALGLAGAFLQSNASTEQVGPFQVRSLWRPFLGLCDGDGFPAASEARLFPPRMELCVGGSAEVGARGFLPEYGEMCRLPGEWTLSAGAPASMEAPTSNPVHLVASSPGTGQLTFQGRGLSATAEVVVHPTSEPPPDGGLAISCGLAMDDGGTEDRPRADGSFYLDGGATTDGDPAGDGPTTRSGCSSAGGPAAVNGGALAWAALTWRRRSRGGKASGRSPHENPVLFR